MSDVTGRFRCALCPELFTVAYPSFLTDPEAYATAAANRLKADHRHRLVFDGPRPVSPEPLLRSELLQGRPERQVICPSCLLVWVICHSESTPAAELDGIVARLTSEHSCPASPAKAQVA